MCLIVYLPAGAKAPNERLWEAHKANPDGWGYMWARGGRLSILKSEDFSAFNPEVLSLFWNCPRVVHFRTASIGRITYEACHPLSVNEELAFCHNGNLFHFSDYFYS